jgi:hypothetical protein
MSDHFFARRPLRFRLYDTVRWIFARPQVADDAHVAGLEVHRRRRRQWRRCLRLLLLWFQLGLLFSARRWHHRRTTLLHAAGAAVRRPPARRPFRSGTRTPPAWRVLLMSGVGFFASSFGPSVFFFGSSGFSLTILMPLMTSQAEGGGDGDRVLLVLVIFSLADDATRRNGSWLRTNTRKA